MSIVPRLDRIRIARRTLFRTLPKRLDHEAEDRHANARVRHIESRPRMREGHVQIEEQKIDYVTVQKPIGQVSHHPREKQRE